MDYYTVTLHGKPKGTRLTWRQALHRARDLQLQQPDHRTGGISIVPYSRPPRKER